MIPGRIQWAYMHCMGKPSVVRNRSLADYRDITRLQLFSMNSVGWSDTISCIASLSDLPTSIYKEQRLLYSVTNCSNFTVTTKEKTNRT